MSQPSVSKAVERDLKELDERRPGLAASSYAAMALMFARTMDDTESGGPTKVAAGKELQGAMDRLRAMAPEGVSGDGVDSLSAARDRRRAAS